MSAISRLLVILAGSVVIVIICPFVGIKWISLVNLNFDPLANEIFYKIRLPRACLSFLVGAALSLSGMAFQALFRNPLATPYTLGVSSGAALGAAVYFLFPAVFIGLGTSGLYCLAIGGALFTILLLFLIAGKDFSTPTMLLSGVALSFFFSSLIMFIQYISDYTQVFRISRWLMGSLNIIEFKSVYRVLLPTLAGLCVFIWQAPELNQVALDDELATARGVNVKRSKLIIFFVTSLMVGAVVAECGVIGFVGMIVPHILRLLIGNDHRILVPATFFFGGAFLTLCDTFARTIIAPTEIPVGVITALLGGPFFVWLLIRKEPER